MKILSFGDLHIGAGVDDDIRDATTYILRQATDIRPDRIIITGDVYEGVTEPEHRNMARDIVIAADAICPVIIIKGNHDIPKDLDILGSLASKHHILVCERPGMVTWDNWAMHILPHFTKAGYISARLQVPSLAQAGIEESGKSVSQIALNYLRAQIASLPEGTNHLLYGHLTMAGSRAENFQPLIGESITFNYHELVEAGFIGGAFGHIHLAQTIGSEGGVQFRYNGAIAPMNYGESAEHKTFSVLDTDTMKVEVYPVYTTKRLTYDATWGGILGFGPPPWPNGECEGARVRIKLKVDEGYVAEDGRTAVRQYMESLNLKELKIEVQTTPKSQVRAAEIAAAKTCSAKLIAYWNATGTTPEEPERTEILQMVDELEGAVTINKGVSSCI